jgi:tetratricopeptide (TPR) repeat protein
VAYARRAVARWPGEPEHRRLLGRAYLGQALAGGDARALSAAEAAFLAARDRRPLDVAGWSALGSFYVEAGVVLQTAYLVRAHEAYAQAVALSPHNARLHVAWAQVDVARKQLGAARRHLQRALELDATDGLAYRLLGDVLLASGDPSGARESYRQARRWLQAP